MGEATKGFWAMVAASAVWGLSPLYYKLLVAVPPLEVLSHRTLWSLVFFVVVLAAQRRLAGLWPALSGRDALGGGPAVIALAAVMISLNWFVFIWSVQNGHTVEASLGYFLFPLVAVALGVLVLGEGLRRAQGVAVAMAALAVALLSWGLGAAPWIALLLAVSFGLYGLVKKRLALSPVLSVAAEVLLLAPLALTWLAVAEWRGAGAFGREIGLSLLLAFSGVLTGGPLLLFSYAARRVRMSTLGLVQYLNPSLQFLCAVVVFAEPFGLWHRLAFGLIWSALLIYSAASLGQPKAVTSRDSSVATSGTASR
jgi:chloramphenicol-sensitive protein RarD